MTRISKIIHDLQVFFQETFPVTMIDASFLDPVFTQGPLFQTIYHFILLD
jgi:hypothetical protein